MDQLPALGTAIAEVVMPTFKIYAPLLKQNADAIKSTPRQTFTYGPHPRQQLDVYYPSSSSSSATATSDNKSPDQSPVLVFLYGGGLVRGDKIHPAIPDGLAHANIGHFFADKYGYTVVVPDYRLLSHDAKFPSGGEDLSLVVKWMLANLGGENSKIKKPRDLLMMGNSAGGIHLSTYLFAPHFEDSRRTVLSDATDSTLRLRAVVELSVPFAFGDADPSRNEVLGTFYGDDIEKNCPLGLLKSVVQGDGVSKLLPGVKFLILNGSLDPQDEILGPKQQFIDAWSAAGSTQADNLKVEMMEGHNHISPPFSLGTGKPSEEAWGDQVAAFFHSVV